MSGQQSGWDNDFPSFYKCNDILWLKTLLGDEQHWHDFLQRQAYSSSNGYSTYVNILESYKIYTIAPNIIVWCKFVHASQTTSKWHHQATTWECVVGARAFPPQLHPHTSLVPATWVTYRPTTKSEHSIVLGSASHPGGYGMGAVLVVFLWRKLSTYFLHVTRELHHPSTVTGRLHWVCLSWLKTQPMLSSHRPY